MSNTIPGFKPIVYGPHEIKNERTEARIQFLENSNNDDKPIPRDLFRPGDIQLISRIGRREYAEKLRKQLLGLPIG